YVAQYILLLWEVLDIFMYPYSPVAGSGNFIALNVQKLIGRNIFRNHVATMRLEHSWEYDAVEYDIILTYEVYQLSIFLLPVVAPHRCQLFGSADVANRRIEPHIQHLTFGTRQRHGYTPVAIAGHGAGVQAI